jgi:hypothetical protein
MKTPTIKRDTYCKYAYVHDDLLHYLENGVSAKETCSALRISLPTYYKYKSIATIETGKIYTVHEEKKFLERQLSKYTQLSNVTHKNNNLSKYNVLPIQSETEKIPEI